MTIYPTEKSVSEPIAQPNKVAGLKQVSKKYPYSKTNTKVIRADFDDFWALKDISFDVEQGHILGIIGRNGAGKTTLLNILAGVLFPTDGQVFIRGRALGLFNLGIGFQDELTGRENIFLNGALLGAKEEEINRALENIIEFSELKDFINMPLGTYSQGMRLRLGFSIIAHLEFDILLIDEILAVGDVLFQNKCFEKLMDFKRNGKTLVITNQSMELLERLCDKVALLDHGRLIFYGEAAEGTTRYRALLNTEQFFVGPDLRNTSLVKNTKKLVDDISQWGQKLGTKEVIIESAEFINQYARICNKIKSGDPLKIRVNFNVRNSIKDIHFGVALFRKDGVYCHGPNTTFDGHNIIGIKPGKGYFELNYKQILLAPGEYKVSIAIWDKNETLAYDYHNGCYYLLIEGNKDQEGELTRIPFKIIPSNRLKNILFKKIKPVIPNKTEGENLETKDLMIMGIKLLDRQGKEKNELFTNEPVSVVVNFDNIKTFNNNHFWLSIFSDEGVCCQGVITRLTKNNALKVFFPKLLLLPGGYSISCGIWDNSKDRFLAYRKNIFPFKMVFNKQDHGIIYLEHNWRWRQ